MKNPAQPRLTPAQKSKLLWEFAVEGPLIALYGTLKKQGRNRAFIDNMTALGHIFHPPEETNKIVCTVHNMAMTVLPGDLPAAYPTNLPNARIVVELVRVTPVGEVQLRKFEGYPEFYGLLNVVVQLGITSKRTAHAVLFSGPWVEGMGVRPLMPKEEGTPVCWPVGDACTLGEPRQISDGGIYV